MYPGIDTLQVFSFLFPFRRRPLDMTVAFVMFTITGSRRTGRPGQSRRVVGGCFRDPPFPAAGLVREEGRHYMSSRSSRWPWVRRMAWDRDRKARSVCHVCGKPIDYFVKASSTDDSWEPDHIVPVSVAPNLELDLMNIAPCHKRCNRIRGNGKTGEKSIGMNSRNW